MCVLETCLGIPFAACMSHLLLAAPINEIFAGLWSLIKRAPKAKIKRKTFEVSGPAKEDAMPLDARARQIFDYFKSYNYTVKSTGDVITFEGKYQASFGKWPSHKILLKLEMYSEVIIDAHIFDVFICILLVF